MLYPEGLPKGWSIDEHVDEDGALYLLKNPKGEWMDEDVDMDRLVRLANHLARPRATKAVILGVLVDAEQRLDELNDRTDVCRRVRALIDALKAEMGGGAEMTPTPRLAVNPPADQAREAYLAATRDLVASPSTSREDADRRHELRRAAGVSGDEDAQICRDLEREVRGR